MDTHNIFEVAEKINISKEYLIPYGYDKAKIDFSILEAIKDRIDGKYIAVTAMTPTPHGEGKTTVAIGLSMALSKIKNTILTLREPSMGPVFGLKGGGTGGGLSKVCPDTDINLHFTGDIHACTAAQNLLVSVIENHIKFGNSLNMDISKICIPRILDIEDRSLRHIITGIGGGQNGILRESYFDITASSETMAILSLASDLRDLKDRLENMIVAFDKKNKPVKAGQLNVTGSLTALLLNALKPNLVQTIEGTPCMIHTGPFANLSHGCSSLIADRIALKFADYVVTEAGFGSDQGFEKLLDIKCRFGNLKVNCAVLVCTVRAIKYHNKYNDGGYKNLKKHIDNIHLFGVPVVVAINKFKDDSDEDLLAIRNYALDKGAEDAVIVNPLNEGSKGCLILAEKVIGIASKKNSTRFLYDTSNSIKENIEKIARKMYGAKRVIYSNEAEKTIRLLEELNISDCPINIAKTPLSLSDDPKLIGCPENFDLHIKSIRLMAGANYILAIAGDILTMPGLPKNAAAYKINVDDNGEITGLF
jgi:formate--tetrahydrofolate ligase